MLAFYETWIASRNPMEHDRKLFGEVAFENGYVTTRQLYEALTLQVKADLAGKPYKFIGQLLIELGYMTEPQVLETLAVLHSPESVAT